MRILEILVIFFSIVLLLSMFLFKNEKRNAIIIGLAILYLIVALQIIIEGYRWQMLLGYIAPLILTLTNLLFAITKSKKKYWKWGISSFSIVYIVVMVGLPLLFPIFSFEKPTGEYFIGTKSYHIIDKNRKEVRSSDKGKHRELMIQIWYPSKEANSLQSEPYIEEVKAITAGIERALSFPAWTLSHLNLVKAHAQKNLGISNDNNNFPILIFSHGMTGFRKQNTFQIEELVSHGYIVVGIDHVFDAAATVFPNGKEVLLEPNNLSGFESLDQHMKIWTEDVSFVLDTLEEWNSDKDMGFFLNGKLNMEKIGMFGHSYGGAAAAQMLLKDSRIKVALNMDGVLYGEPIPTVGFSKPYMQMNAEKSIDKSIFDASLDAAISLSGRSRSSYESFWKESQERRENASKGKGFTMVISNTSHMSYTDFHLFSPLLCNKGEDIRKVHKIINELSLAFFDEFLLEKGSGLILEKANNYPEIGLLSSIE
ncbi:carboxylic ester hydrolase [Cytobacillus solani]|nr:carboxylic ester hydrolase [Cytobacillus solani]USK54247.1 carboxylic ester hydrolase [Cytobacillus solani]